MPTTTLFQTLQLGQTTWHIETVVPVSSVTPPVATPEPVATGEGVDPWPLAPLYRDEHGRGVYSATRKLPQIKRTK